jgi:hypothetical protein
MSLDDRVRAIAAEEVDRLVAVRVREEAAPVAAE